MSDSTSHNSTASSAIRVAIIEDRPEIRDGLVQILNHAKGFACVGSYGTMEAALAQLPLLAVKPKVVLIDLGLPAMSGLEGIHLLHERQPEWLLLMLTVFDDDTRIFQALCAGAAGYLLKKTSKATITKPLPLNSRSASIRFPSTSAASTPSCKSIPNPRL